MGPKETFINKQILLLKCTLILSNCYSVLVERFLVAAPASETTRRDIEISALNSIGQSEG